MDAELAKIYEALGDYKPDGFMARMGIQGWEALEAPLLSFLLGGGPMLLVGTHGEAKTVVGKALAIHILGVPHATYDASKAVFEDLLGFPNISQIADKEHPEVDYLPTKLSIWGKRFVFIDEVSRAQASLQSKWLEVIRSRTLMGLATGVKFVMAAMNPLGYEGTQALDEALASRFAIVLNVPRAIDLSIQKLAKVAATRTHDDEPALSFWREVREGSNGENGNSDVIVSLDKEKVAADARGIQLLVQAAELLYHELSDLRFSFIDEYASSVCKELSSKVKVHIDGRRVVMVSGNLKRIFAIEAACRRCSLTDLFLGAAPGALALQTLYYSFPIGVDEKFKVTQAQMVAAHKSAEALLQDRASLAYRISREREPIKKLQALFAEDKVDLVTVEHILHDILPPTGNLKPQGGQPAAYSPEHLICYLLAMEGMRFPATILSYLVGIHTPMGTSAASPLPNADWMYQVAGVLAQRFAPSQDPSEFAKVVSAGMDLLQPYIKTWRADAKYA